MRRLKLRNLTICLCLICVLTFTVGAPIKRVEAVATTATLISSALLGVGVVYIAYQTLTGANVYVPYDNTFTTVQDYLRGVGQDVVKTSSGNRIYNKIYSFLQDAGLIEDYDVHLTREQLLDLYNDNKNISDMQDITGFTELVDVSQIPINGYDYQLTFESVPEVVNGYTFSELIARGQTIEEFTGPKIIFQGTDGSTIISTNLSDAYYYRNYWDGNSYEAQYSTDGITWQQVNGAMKIGYDYHNGDYHGYIMPNWSLANYKTVAWNVNQTLQVDRTYPCFPMERIYDAINDEYMPLVPTTPDHYRLTPDYPNNTDRNGNKYPLVPYVQLPSTNQWGFNIGDFLTDIVNRTGQIITASWLGQLINQYLQSLSGTGDYYDFSEYNDNSITYYNNTNYDNDYNYYTYNYDVSEEQNIIPVDLNQIKEYTDNTYLDVIKQRAIAAGETFGEYVAFWHNVDSELVYVCFGSVIVVLLGAFIGKWGHS